MQNMGGADDLPDVDDADDVRFLVFLHMSLFVFCCFFKHGSCVQTLKLALSLFYFRMTLQIATMRVSTPEAIFFFHLKAFVVTLGLTIFFPFSDIPGLD